MVGFRHGRQVRMQRQAVLTCMATETAAAVGMSTAAAKRFRITLSARCLGRAPVASPHRSWYWSKPTRQSTQVPAWQVLPSVQLFPAQQGFPSTPQSLHRAPRQTRPGSHVWLAQQTSSDRPQSLHVPKSQTRNACSHEEPAQHGCSSSPHATHFPSPWQTRLSPQSVPTFVGSASQRLLEAQRWHAGQVESQTISVPQLLVALLHRPAQVLAADSGKHFFFFFFRFLRLASASWSDANAAPSIPTPARARSTERRPAVRSTRRARRSNASPSTGSPISCSRKVQDVQ